MHNTDDLMSIEEASAFLNLSVGHLANLRSEGAGPSYVKRGREVRYIRKDLERWDAKRTTVHLRK